MEQDVILASQAWINAGGFILISLGIGLLMMEFVLPSYGLFGFAGASSIVIGVIQLHQTGYIEKLPFNVKTLGLMFGIGLVLSFYGAKQTYRLYRKQNTTGVESMIGGEVYILHWRGNKGRISVKGEDWLAFTDEDRDFKRGDKVLISKVEDLRVKISHIESKF